jgi:hypothetical protein
MIIIQDLIGNAARRQVTGMHPPGYIDVVLPVYIIPLRFRSYAL